MSGARTLIAFLVGAVFSFGLAVSGVLDPRMVRGFLDFFGSFDPRLGFLFAGAVVVSAAGYLLSRRLAKPVAAARFAIPAGAPIDTRLIAGAALFGVGWGMVGLCPGPAIAGLALGVPEIFIFTTAMFVGFSLYGLIDRRRVARAAPAQ
jgi:uncharacterized membrane protein YedE/YeeE